MCSFARGELDVPRRQSLRYSCVWLDAAKVREPRGAGPHHLLLANVQALAWNKGKGFRGRLVVWSSPRSARHPSHADGASITKLSAHGPQASTVDATCAFSFRSGVGCTPVVASLFSERHAHQCLFRSPCRRIRGPTLSRSVSHYTLEGSLPAQVLPIPESHTSLGSACSGL